MGPHLLSLWIPSVSPSIVLLNINKDNAISSMTHLSYNPGHGTANEFMANSISAGDHYHSSPKAYKEKKDHFKALHDCWL